MSGMSSRLPRKDGLIQLERTGPFVPPMTFPGIGDIVVTDAFRAELEASDLTGFTFAPTIKTRIVELEWQTWDRTAPKPRLLPPGGEPESYLLANPHSRETSGRIGPLWEFVPASSGTAERRTVGPQVAPLASGFAGRRTGEGILARVNGPGRPRRVGARDHDAPPASPDLHGGRRRRIRTRVRPLSYRRAPSRGEPREDLSGTRGRPAVAETPPADLRLGLRQLVVPRLWLERRADREQGKPRGTPWP